MRGIRVEADVAIYPDSTSKNADDIVITLAIRTPLAKAKKGGFKDTSLEYMVYALLKEVRERSAIDPALIEDICLGNVCHTVQTTSVCSEPPLNDRGRLGLGRKSRLQTPRRLPCCRDPQCLRCLLCKSFLLLWAQGHRRHCQCHLCRQHRSRYRDRRRVHDHRR